MAIDTTSATAAAGVDPARARIAGSIKQAASTTGASFEYLLATAKMESNFNPKAAASTSSARGLFQFIDQTWLGTVKEAGAHLGYGKYADAITKNPSGSYSVNDPDARAAIMKLRDDPEAASSMAAVLTQSNSFKLTGKIGRRPTDAELYMAHFMGVGGAGKLIQNAEDNPNASAAQMFPNAAAANQSIFYDRAGTGAQRLAGLFGAEHALRRPPPIRRSRKPRWRLPAAICRGASRSRATRRRWRRRSTTPPISSSFPDQRNVTPVAANRRKYDDRLGAARTDLPLAVPGRRTHAADLAGGAGIMGQQFVADLGERRPTSVAASNLAVHHGSLRQTYCGTYSP